MGLCSLDEPCQNLKNVLTEMSLRSLHVSMLTSPLTNLNNHAKSAQSLKTSPEQSS